MIMGRPVEDLLTMEQVEQEYQVKRSALYRYVRKGYLKTYKRAMDRRVYVRRADVEALGQFITPKDRGRVTLGAVQRARDFQQRVFGKGTLPSSSSELIEEARLQRTENLP